MGFEIEVHHFSPYSMMRDRLDFKLKEKLQEVEVDRNQRAATMHDETQKVESTQSSVQVSKLQKLLFQFTVAEEKVDAIVQRRRSFMNNSENFFGSTTSTTDTSYAPVFYTSLTFNYFSHNLLVSSYFP